MIHPSIETFRGLAKPGALVPVYEEIVADLETPVAAYLKIAKGQDYAFLLESVDHTGTLGRYSFIGANPSVIFRSKGKDIRLFRGGAVEEYASDDPLGELRALMQDYNPVKIDGMPAFHGGAVGYLSYDQVRFFEHLPDENPDVLDLPDLYFMITDTMLIFDHVRNKIQIVSNVHVQDDADAAYNEGIRKIGELAAKMRGPLSVSTERLHSAPDEGALESNFSREEYCAAVRKAKEYICAGDIFQVVLSERFRRPLKYGR